MNTDLRWNGRGNLEQLMAELDRQAASKIDFVADARQMEVQALSDPLTGHGDDMIERPRHLKLCAMPGTPVTEWLTEPHRITDSALAQFGHHVSPQVPTKFLREFAKQWPSHAGRFLSGLMYDNGKRNLIRCLDGRVRACLSDQYRVLDHMDIAFAALKSGKEAGAVPIECSLTDSRMRLRMIAREVTAELETSRAEPGHMFLGSKEIVERMGINPDDLPGGANTVFPVVTVYNSETGHGGFHVRLGIFEKGCYNTAIIENVAGEIHLGSKLDAGIYQPSTISLEARTIMAKACDAVTSAFTPERWQRIVANLNEAEAQAIESPSSAVENFVKTQDAFPDSMKDALLKHFIDDYNLTALGMARAVSRVAQDVESPDRQDELERLSGQIIAKPSLVVVAA